ncbi:MAG: TonB-dependent receptor [Proteobacteria bacterium]|nr:TonB-dependent receptor [Pseudomonadota bacterium]
MASSALLAAVLTTHAQAQTRPAASAAASGTTIEELVVTAERREQSLQDVPVAVTAFSAHQRAIEGITTVQDITNYTPGLTYSSQLDRPVIRGLARNNNIYLSDSAVAVYYDDFFSNSTYLVGRDDMVIDQVEVLLGPQGTLYGRNAVGGLINTLSKRPSEDFGGEVRAIVGNYGYTKFEGTVTGPTMIPGLTFRLSAYDLNQTKGYFKNLVGPTEGDVRHDPYVDAQLEYKTDKDDIWLDAYAVWFDNDRGGPGGLLGIPTAGHYDTSLTQPGQLVFNPNFPFGGGAVPGSVVGIPAGLTDNPALKDIRTFAHAQPTNIIVNAAPTITLHWTHHFDGFDLKYIGGYSQYHYDLKTAYFNNDNSPVTSYQVPLAPGGTCAQLNAAFGAAGCSPLTVRPRQIFEYEAHPDWSSHEIDISSTKDGPFQWIAGVYRYDEIDNNPERFQEPDQAQIANPLQVIPLLGAGQLVAAPANPSLDYLLLNYQDHISSTAVFGQIDWKFTDTLKLTAGLRYTYDQKHGQEEARYIVFQDLSAAFSAENLGSLLQPVDITPVQISTSADKGTCSAPTLQTTGKYAGDYVRCLKDHSSAATGTIGLSWTPDKDTLVYGRYNRGYKAFGFNAGYIGTNVEAAPEYVDDFEGGIKKTWQHFTLDAAAFYYNYRDAQIPIGVPVGSVTVTEFINIPKSISDGIEITAVWNPVDNLYLSLVYGLDHTRIQSGCSLVGGVAKGACYVDTADPAAAATGARPVGTTGAQAVSGNSLPQSPENKVAFNANYTFKFDAGDLILSGSYIWKDKSWDSIFRRTYDEAPAWDQVDLRATWSGNHDKYELVAYVRNVFNTLGYDAAAGGYPIAAPVGGGGFTQAPAYDLTPPRTYGFEVHYKF